MATKKGGIGGPNNPGSVLGQPGSSGGSARSKGSKKSSRKIGGGPKTNGPITGPKGGRRSPGKKRSPSAAKKR